MEPHPTGPIHSLLVDEQALERLDGFVVDLGERIDGIQEAEQLGHLEEAAKRAGELALAHLDLFATRRAGRAQGGVRPRLRDLKLGL